MGSEMCIRDRIGDLIAALPAADAIALTWRMFGNNGIIEYKDRLITDQFARAAPKIMHWPWRAFMIKTLYRNNGIYGKLGVHRPKQPDSDRVKDAQWFSGDAVFARDCGPNIGRPRNRVL